MPPRHRPRETAERFRRQFRDEPVPYADALAAGFTLGSLRAAVTNGLLHRPRRGLYAVVPPGGATFEEQRARHIAAIRSALAVLGPGAMASHESAALLHGLATPRAGVAPVVTLTSPRTSQFAGPGLLVRGSDVPTHRLTEVDGIACTSIPRTAVDLARGRQLPEALIALDSAARLIVAAGTGTSAASLRWAVRRPALAAEARLALVAVTAECLRWPGIGAVRRAIPITSPAAESAPESRSRGWFIEEGIDGFLPGYPLEYAGTTYWADLCHPGARLVGEVDGWGKYGDSHDSVRSRLAAERERQRNLEDAGWRFVRWSSTDSRLVVLRRVGRALERPRH